MLQIIPLFANHDMTFIGRRRGNALPAGLRAMLENAFGELGGCGLRPATIVVGDEEDFKLRASNAILKLRNDNVLMGGTNHEPLIEAWASFLRWYSWWSMPHWTHRSFNQGFYAGLCTTCKQYS